MTSLSAAAQVEIRRAVGVTQADHIIATTNSMFVVFDGFLEQVAESKANGDLLPREDIADALTAVPGILKSMRGAPLTYREVNRTFRRLQAAINQVSAPPRKRK